MATFLFEKVVFGPIKSRRLGESLGVNLLPLQSKLCNFDCIYCECGWTESHRTSKVKLPDSDQVHAALEKKLIELLAQKKNIDVITFAGNGEPTLHPDFAIVVNSVVNLRNKYYPKAKIALLSNGTQVKKRKISNSLSLIDLCILKLDAGTEELFQLINKPVSRMRVSDIVESISKLNIPVIIQSLFFKGSFEGRAISNLDSKNIDLWLKRVIQIQPESVMVYTIDRETPAKQLLKADDQELDGIRQLLKQSGIKS